jgi:general secretion pathway protein J
MKRPRNGFTLIEMLVALGVFALIAVGALALLRFSSTAELANRQRIEQMGATRRFLAVLNADLAQAAPRPSRDETGAPHPAFEQPANIKLAGGTLLRLTRSGWSNPDGEPRSGSQKVEYRWTGRAIARAAYPFTDGAVAGPATTLLPLSAPPALRFRDRYGNWHDTWASERDTDLPVAIELLLPQPRGEPMRVVALVGVNYQ